MARISRRQRHAILACLLALAANRPGAEGHAAQRRHHLDDPEWVLGQRDAFSGRHARQMLQSTARMRAGVADAQAAQQHVLTIGQDLFGEFMCLTPCFGGYECLYQSAYLGPCDSLDSRWLYDNSTQHLRQLVQPDICLTMCPTQNSTEGPCAVHNQILSKLEQHVGVYWAECVDSGFQRWRRAPQQQWRSAANDYCVTAETQSCGDLSSCANASAPVGNQHSVIAGPCGATTSTAWLTNDTLAAPPVQLAKDPPPPPLLTPAPLSEAQQLGTYQLVAAGVPGTQCLVAEFATACNAGQDGAVCAWHNAAVRDCDVYAAAPLSQHPEDVWFSSPGPATALLWAGAPQADSCLDECARGTITGACAFPNVSSNVGWQQCSGASNQRWAFNTTGRQQQSPTTTLAVAAPDARSCLGYEPICVMDGRPSRPLSDLTQDNTVIPASCWNAATNDSLSWASQPISNDTNLVPVLNNAQMQPCADGAAGSLQLWTRNYVLSGGTASISSKAQVDVQLTLRLQGLALLTFGSQAASSVLTALEQQVPDLARLKPQVQQIAHYACRDPRSDGIGCRLAPQELTQATGAGAAQFRGKIKQVMFTAAFTATGVETGNILDALRLTSSDGAETTIVAAQAALAAAPPVDSVNFRNLTKFDVLVSGMDVSSSNVVAAAAASKPSGGAIAGIVIGVVLGLACVAVLAWLFVARWRRRQQFHDALLLPTVSSDFDANGGTSKQSTMMFGGKPDTSRLSVWSVKSGSSRGMRTMGKMDASIQGWYIDPAEVSICKRPEDGEDWLLGTGSYGKVYKALRGGVQDVAVKVLLATDEEQLLQFEKEIGILKSISYDRNIVQFYGATMVGSEPMLLLEYCEGGDLRGALGADNAEADLDGERQLGWYASGHKIALDVARGLSFLHGINVVHSDLKALNILLTRGWEVAKIGDVGVARFMHAKDGSGEVAMGTFAYAAPETLLGIDSGVKSDIFSFGVVLWEIVTGGFATRGRLHPAVVPEQCPQTIADLITACMRPDPDERPTARQVFESMRDAAAPMLNWHGSADYLHNGGSSESPSTSNHASGPLHPVQEEVGSRPLIGPSPLGARLPSNTSMVSSLGQGGTGGTNRSRNSQVSGASRPSTHIERSSVSVGAGSFSRHSAHSPAPSRDTARWHRHAAVARFRAESAPIFGPWPGAQAAAALQRGNSSGNVPQPSPRKLQEWASTLRPSISCGAPEAGYNAYADFDAAQGQTPPAGGGGRQQPPRSNGQRSALSPQLKAMSSPECAAAMTAAAAAVAGGQRHPQHAHPVHRHHRAGSAEMMRPALGEPSVRVVSASAAEPRNPFIDASYQDSLSGDLRADSDTALAHGTGGTPHGSALSTASAGSYSHADGSSSPLGTSSPGDGSGGSRPSASQGGRVRRPPLPPASPNGSQTPGDSTPERKRPGASSPYAALYSLPMSASPQGGPPKMQRLDEPMINSQPAGSPYVTFLESPSSHDFQRGERMRPSPPASPARGGMVAAAVAGSVAAAAAAGVAAAASAVHGLWSEPSFAPAAAGTADGKPPGFNGAVVGPNPFGSDAQPPANPFAAPDVQRASPPNPFASLSAMEQQQQSAASQGSMSPQSSTSMSVSPRRPPPSPYASMSLQSASSADDSGPPDSAAGGSGPLSAQAFLPGARRQPAATVLEEGRSGSLEARDRAVSFENWKQVEVLAASSGRLASHASSAGNSSAGSRQGVLPASPASPARLQPQTAPAPASASSFAAASTEPWPRETSSPPATPKFAQQPAAAVPAAHSRSGASAGGSNFVAGWQSEPGPAAAGLSQEEYAAASNSASAPPALPRGVAAILAADDILQRAGSRGSARAKSAPKKPLSPEPAVAWPGFQPQPSLGMASVRRSSAPATARVVQPGAPAAAAAHPIFVPESSFWQLDASAALQGIWRQWGTQQQQQQRPASAGGGGAGPQSLATRSACEPRPAAQRVPPAPPPPLETRPSFEDVVQFAYEDEGRQPSTIVRPRSADLDAPAAAGAAHARAGSAGAPAPPQAGVPAVQRTSQPLQPAQQQQPRQHQQPAGADQQLQQPPPQDAGVQMPAVAAVQRDEGVAADTVSKLGGLGRQFVRSVSRGSISRPNLGRPSLGRSSLGIASVSRRSVSRVLPRVSPPLVLENGSVATTSAEMPHSPYAAFTGPPPPPAAAALSEAAAAAPVPGQPGSSGPASPATPSKQRGTAPSLLASAAAYKASRAATPERLPVEGAAQVRAAADAAAEAMASRFAGGRKAAHAAHAIGNGRPVVPPETPSQSREPTPRDGDAAPQITGRPQLRRTSVRRHTQKIRPSMLPLAALTVAGSASASSLNEDGLAALEALLEARSAAEKAKAAADGPEDRLEDLPAKLASLRSVPPAVRTARPSNGRISTPSPFTSVSRAATSAARAARSASVPAPVPGHHQPSPISSPGRVTLPRSPFADDEPSTRGYFRDVTPYSPGAEPPVLRADTRQQAFLNGSALRHSRSLPNRDGRPQPTADGHPAGETEVRCTSRAQSLRNVAEAEAAADRELDHLMTDLSDWSAAEQAGLLRG